MMAFIDLSVRIIPLSVIAAYSLLFLSYAVFLNLALALLKRAYPIGVT